MLEARLSRRIILKGLAGGSLAVLAASLPLVGCARSVPKAPDFKLKFLSVGEYRTIERIAAVMLPGGSGAEPAGLYGVARQADLMLDGLDPLMQEQFHQVLMLFESVPVLGWKLQVFSAQNDVAATEYLRAWQHSSIGVLRQGFAGLKRLAVGVYFSDPRSWEAIGYDGVWVGNRDMGFGIDNQSWEGDLVNPNVYRKFEA